MWCSPGSYACLQKLSYIHPSIPPLSSPSFHSICWINILLDRGLFWIDSLSELHRKASFFRTLDLYWLSYLSISGPAEPLHFLARSLSLHLRLFASISPPVCMCLSSSIPSCFFFLFFVFFSQGTPHFITFFLHSSIGQNTYLYRMIWSWSYEVLQGPWEWHIFFGWSLYRSVVLPLCHFFFFFFWFLFPSLCVPCGSTAGLFMFCSLVTSLFVVPRYSKCFW